MFKSQISFSCMIRLIRGLLCSSIQQTISIFCLDRTPVDLQKPPRPVFCSRQVQPEQVAEELVQPSSEFFHLTQFDVGRQIVSKKQFCTFIQTTLRGWEEWLDSSSNHFLKFSFLGTVTEKIDTDQIYDVQATNIFCGVFLYNTNCIPVFHPILKVAFMQH